MAEIFIYDIIGEGLFEDGVTAAGVRDELKAADGADVLVRINSPGGNPFEGVAIKTLLDGYDGSVSVQVDGLAASAASIIALAGSSVAMADGAMLMIHDPWTITVGDEAEHQRTTSALGKIADSMAGMYAKRTGGSSDAMRELMVAETWMAADEAIGQGFADSRIESPAAACKIPDGFGYKNAPKNAPKPATKTPEPVTNKAQYAATIRKRKIDLTRAEMHA